MRQTKHTLTPPDTRDPYTHPLTPPHTPRPPHLGAERVEVAPLQAVNDRRRARERGVAAVADLQQHRVRQPDKRARVGGPLGEPERAVRLEQRVDDGVLGALDLAVRVHLQVHVGARGKQRVQLGLHARLERDRGADAADAGRVEAVGDDARRGEQRRGELVAAADAGEVGVAAQVVKLLLR